MGFDLRDRFETEDGSRPQTTQLDDAISKRLPLAAFALLAGGDVFDRAGAAAKGGAARRYAQSLEVNLHGADEAMWERIKDEIGAGLSGNPTLVQRLESAKSIHFDLVPQGQRISDLGYPRAVARHAAGIFWDKPEWPRARIALRVAELGEALVAHEMAHAIFSLAFAARECELIYALLRPTFGSRAAMDEVFAIYSEREMLEGFSRQAKAAPGVYGFARRQWSEDHLFTRFVRKLYWPHKPLAGPKLPGGDWMRSVGR